MRLLLWFLCCVTTFTYASLVSDPKQIELQRIREFQEKILPIQKELLGDEHLLFSRREEAIAWVTGMANQIQLSFGAKKFQMLASTDPRYVSLQQYVHELWAGFTQLFPEQTSKLNEPPVVLVDTEVVNAFVGMDSASGKVGHAVIVFTGFLDAVQSDKDAITGTFAHELAHSVFKHAIPRHQKSINKFYRAKVADLGYQAPRDNALDKKMDQWIEAAKVAGDLSNDELLNLPSFGFGQPWLTKAWAHLRRSLYDTRSECQSASAQYADWSTLIEADSLGQAFFVPLGNLSSLREKSQAVIAADKNCLGSKTKKFSEIFSAITGISVASLEQSEEFRVMAQKFESSPSAIEGFRFLVNEHRQIMLSIEKETSLSELGYFTYEEHADDISLLVHSMLNENPEAMSHFLMRYMEKSDPQVATECKKRMEKGGSIPSGSFSDAHRSSCYRMAHLRDMNLKVKRIGDISGFATEYLLQTLPR